MGSKKAASNLSVMCSSYSGSSKGDKCHTPVRGSRLYEPILKCTHAATTKERLFLPVVRLYSRNGVSSIERAKLIQKFG